MLSSIEKTPTYTEIKLVIALMTMQTQNTAFIATTFPKKDDTDAKGYQADISAQSITKKNPIY